MKEGDKTFSTVRITGSINVTGATLTGFPAAGGTWNGGTVTASATFQQETFFQNALTCNDFPMYGIKGQVFNSISSTGAGWADLATAGRLPANSFAEGRVWDAFTTGAAREVMICYRPSGQANWFRYTDQGIAGTAFRSCRRANAQSLTDTQSGVNAYAACFTDTRYEATIDNAWGVNGAPEFCYKPIGQDAWYRSADNAKVVSGQKTYYPDSWWRFAINGNADSGSNATTITGNTLRAYKIYLPFGCTVKAGAIKSAASLPASGNVLVGIYSMGANGMPGDLLVGSPVIAVSATGNTVFIGNFATAVTLRPGWYWAVSNQSMNTANLIPVVASSAPEINMGVGAGNVTNIPVNVAYSITAALTMDTALPTVFPSSNLLANSAAGNIPRIFFQLT